MPINMSIAPSVRTARDNASHFILGAAALVAAGVLFVAPTPVRAADEPIVLGPVKVEDANQRNNQKPWDRPQRPAVDGAGHATGDQRDRPGADCASRA